MLEHPQHLNITQSELAPRVADYFDTLLAQRDAILARYHLTPETAGQFCDLHTSEEDREKILALYENIVYVLQNKDIPPSEMLILERMREQQRINEFFGKDAHIEVPPLPPTITPERIEQWKQKRFELRYLPPLTIKEDSDYPGWKNRQPFGSDYFDQLARINSLPENQNNPHLANLAPNQLPGCWMLVDTRPKPDYRDGMQTYEDDSAIQSIIKQLAFDDIVNQEAKEGRRNLIHPSKFNNPLFWEPFYDYFGIDSDDNAIIRLPRSVEHGVFRPRIGDEWAEDYCYSDHRFVCLGYDSGRGMNILGFDGRDSLTIWFSPVVVFTST